MKPKIPFPASSLIQKLYDEEKFSYLELTLPVSFGKKPLLEEEILLLANLIQASAHGHLCLEMKEEITLSEHLVEKVEEGQIPNKPFCLWKNRLYLQRNWILETKVLSEMKKERKPSPIFSESIYFSKLKEMEKELNPSQAHAARKAFASPLFFLCGGPGTGKTYTARFLLELFTESLLPGLSLHAAIAAPTGKAMMHLKEKIAPNREITALTIHSLLRKSKPVLPYDLIFIDESSMIDIKLMASLLDAISDETRVIFLGDPEQLPPVEAGSIFSDLITAYPLMTSVLEKPMRFENEELISLSIGIQRNDFPVVEKLLKTGKSIQYIPEMGRDELISSILPMLKQQRSFRLLSCLRVGAWGVDAINDVILDLLLKDLSYGDLISIPIIITENDHVKGLYNGMQGVAICEYRGKKNLFISQKDKASFHGENKPLEIACQNLPKFDLAYCLSVHKSQGSEYDHVFLIAPKGCESFGREIFYTAATRAKKNFSLFASFETIKEAMSKSSQRISSLCLRN